MKDVFSLVLVVLGASIFGRGFKMLSPALQDKFAKEMYEKMSAFLTKRAVDGATRVDVNRTLLSRRRNYPPRN